MSIWNFYVKWHKRAQGTGEKICVWCSKFNHFVFRLVLFTYYAAVINAVFYRAAKESGFGGSPVKERVSGIAAL